MVDDAVKYAEFVVLLKEQGHSEDEIQKILDRIRQYDSETNFLSQMDSIDGDEFGVAAIIARALGESSDESPED